MNQDINSFQNNQISINKRQFRRNMTELDEHFPKQKFYENQQYGDVNNMHSI